MSPLAAAWREIREETTLTPTSLAVYRQGKSYTFTDGVDWAAVDHFPSRLPLKSRGRSRQARRRHPDRLGARSLGVARSLPVQEDSDTFGGVPRLAESLRRVFFELDIGSAAGKVLSDGLENL